MHDTIESPTQEVEALAHDLDRLLARHKTALKQEGIDRQMENLKSLLESTRHDFAASNRMTETGNAWLTEICGYLKQTVEERQRLEGEGGLPATREQMEQNEELLRTIRRIENILDRSNMTSH